MQKDTSERITIPQILAHSWFTTRKAACESESPFLTEFRAVAGSDDPVSLSYQSSEVSTQASSSPFVIDSVLDASTPTTPDENSDDLCLLLPDESLRRAPSDSTIGKGANSQPPSRSEPFENRQPATVPEEGAYEGFKPPSPQFLTKASMYPIRTPVRTKHRSISSTLSDHSEATGDKVSTPIPPFLSRDLDFASLLTRPTPIIFSTPLEGDLLNTLSSLGFDAGQIVHSVLSNACDSASAVWWMLRKKAERKATEDVEPVSATSLETPRPIVDVQIPKEPSKTNRAIQTDYEIYISPARSAPQLALLPATPTTARPKTPPTSPNTRSPLLSPSSSSITGEYTSVRSHPSTPDGSLREKEKDKRKARSGSVSIMQRATTALEAAGLVRKKSTEIAKEKERDKSRDEPRSSHGSGSAASSKLTKSPTLKPSKDKDHLLPVTPPPTEQHSIVSSPWILTQSKDSPYTSAVTTLTIDGQIQPQSASNTDELDRRRPTMRPRANFLTVFRHWFNEDRKGKQKDTSLAQSNLANHARPSSQPVLMATQKRRGSTSSGKYVPRTGTNTHRGHRPSVSSRRSNSVNSRRSSGIPVESPKVTSRRSFGSHTPNSDRGEFSSRPSSIHSFSMQPRHRKSPSQSSASSTHFRTASPLQKYHRRAGSGSSTRVIRLAPTNRGTHGRSNSATSSIHSLPNSRPTSLYEPSEGENTAILKSRTRSRDRLLGGSSLFVQKRPGSFLSPILSHTGRSSWKKSWGLEPPGWQTRTAHLPIEVLVISPATEPTAIRDVFSSRQSLSLGDESDWVDEDEDIPVFAGGLGQMGTSTSLSSSLGHNSIEGMPVMPVPSRGSHKNSKRTNRGDSMMSGQGNSKPKALNERVSPIPQEQVIGEARTSRRQLPVVRSGPAFRQAIQEEDEDEEEE